MVPPILLYRTGVWVTGFHHAENLEKLQKVISYSNCSHDKDWYHISKIEKSGSVPLNNQRQFFKPYFIYIKYEIYLSITFYCWYSQLRVMKLYTFLFVMDANDTKRTTNPMCNLRNIKTIIMITHHWTLSSSHQSSVLDPTMMDIFRGQQNGFQSS